MGNDLAQTNPKLKMQAIGMMVGLTIQYLLGMFVNLYIKFPEGKPEGQLWVFAWKQIPIALHIIIGLLLLIGTISLIVRSIVSKNKTWTIASSIAAASIFAAIASGSLFIPSQKDNYSFIMAIGFIIAFLSYAWGLYNSNK